MKNIRILVLFIFISTLAISQHQIDHYIFVKPSNSGAVKSILIRSLGDNFRIRGKKKIWQQKELNYAYRVSFNDRKLRIFYKGTRNDVAENIEFMFDKIQALN